MDVTGRIANFFSKFWAARASASPGGEVHRIDGLVIALTNVPVPGFNATTVMRTPEDPEAALTAAVQILQAKAIRFGIDLDPLLHGEVHRWLTGPTQSLGSRMGTSG